MSENSHERSPVSAPPALTGIGPIDLALRLVDIAGKIIVALSSLMILVFILGQVLDRHFLKGWFNAYEQIAQMWLIWLAFVGMAMAFRERTNIVVDVIDMVLPARIVMVKAILLDVLALVLMYLLFIYGLQMVTFGGNRLVMGTPFTYALVYLGMVVGTALIALFLVVRIVMGTIRLVAPEKSGAGT